MADTRLTKREETTLDRLDSLSDGILLLILANLDTQYAVKTCVLSRRWRTLWKSLPSISFVDPLHESLRYSEKRATAFSDFVTHVLFRRHHSDIVNFRLLPLCLMEPSFVEPWLEYAIKHNVKFIDLGVSSYEDHRGIVFPRCLFDCSSLQSLKLRYGCQDSIRWPPHVNWPALKSLYVGNLSLGNINFDGRIFSSCPSLETLKIQFIHARVRGDSNENKTFKIHSQSLRSLELVHMISHDHPYQYTHMIVIVAPKLTTFQFSGEKPVVCSVDAPSLENVTINLRPGTGLYSSSQVSFDENARETILRSIKMVNEFHFSKSLSIAFETIEVLSALPDLLEVHMRKFGNLKDFNVIPLKHGKCSSISPLILSFFPTSSTVFNLDGVKPHCDLDGVEGESF